MEEIQEANLDPDKSAKLERLLGQDYEVVTADARLDKLADDLVDHCSARWQCGKSMLVCIDKITCARMYERVTTRWKRKVAALRREANAKASASVTASDADEKECTQREWDALRDLNPPQTRFEAGEAGGARGFPLAPPAGFEPATTGLEIRCSIRLSYGGMAETPQPIEYEGYRIRARMTTVKQYGEVTAAGK